MLPNRLNVGAFLSDDGHGGFTGIEIFERGSSAATNSDEIVDECFPSLPVSLYYIQSNARPPEFVVGVPEFFLIDNVLVTRDAIAASGLESPLGSGG